MKIIEKRISELKPYENNPRNNDAAVDAVAASIKEFGFKVPIIIDRNNVIVCGHTRVKSAERLQMDKVPCILADDLTEKQIKAFRLADNKTAELANWIPEKLEEELADLADVDMSQYGFEELEAALDGLEIIEDDYEPEPPEEPKTKLGDIFRLGRHKLMCGDSTDQKTIEILMGGAKADITITSPPYGASKSAKIREHYERGKETQKSFYADYDDDVNEWRRLMQSSYECMKMASSAQFINVQMLADNKRDLVGFVNDNINEFCDLIVWDKKAAPPQMCENVLNNQFEFVFIFGGDKRTVPFGSFHGNKNNVIVQTVGNNEYSEIHRAVYPVELPAKIIDIASRCESVLDPFGGTGTTMIACEQLGRNCFMMELDPHYCDVIIDRWEQFTGEKAEKIN